MPRGLLIIERFYARHLPLAREMATPADLWRPCKSVRGLVAEVAQCDMAIRKLLPELQSRL